MTWPDDLRDLLQIPGVSGYEQPVTDYIRSRLPAGLDARMDAIGNLVVTFGSGTPHLLFIVHTDEVGFVVSGVRDDGAVYLTPVGSWDLHALGGRQVDIHSRAGVLPGVVVTVPPHLGGNNDGPPPWIDGEQIIVDVGTDSAAETGALGVSVLDSATIARHSTILPGGHLVARGLDNRFGCYLLLSLARELAAESPARGAVTLAWASQEEVGFRGPKALAHEGRFDAVLAIDAYPADRRPAARMSVDSVRPGKGPVLRGADLTGVGSISFVAGIRRLASKLGLPLQPAYAQGHNQASVFHTSFAAALDLPVSYLHSTVESIHAGDLETARRLLSGMVALPRLEELWS